MLVHRFAIATAVATYLLILIGGLVHGTGSSLACPDWPTCYGTFMPRMEGGVLVEHSHRLAVALVVAQALLGGITVVLRLPTPISTAHTATSLLFFLTVIYIAARSRPVSAFAPPRASLSGRATGLAII